MKTKKASVQETPKQEKVTKKTRSEKVMKIVNISVNVLLVVVIVFAAICTYVSFVNTSGNGVPSIFGLRLMSIQTPSMKPTIDDGDLIVSTAVDPEDLRPKDIITYWTNINGERVLNTHRIENIYDGGDFLIFETKGDANTSVDPLTVDSRELVGKYQFRIPGLGKVFDYLKTGTGFFVVVVIPVFIFFIFHLVQFFRALFEYQNVKNRIKFEQERDEADAEKEAEKRLAVERAALEQKIREELLAEMKAEREKAEDAPREAELVPEEDAPREAELVPEEETPAE